jgi:hypothetical protein
MGVASRKGVRLCVNSVPRIAGLYCGRKTGHRLASCLRGAASGNGSVFTALQEDRFYILPHPEWKAQVQLRMEDILYERTPQR